MLVPSTFGPPNPPVTLCVMPFQDGCYFRGLAFADDYYPSLQVFLLHASHVSLYLFSG